MRDTANSVHAFIKYDDERFPKAREAFMKETPMTKEESSFTKWEKDYSIALGDKAAMTDFPFPELSECGNGCQIYKDARVCQHNLKPFFLNSGKFSRELLKEHSHLWHPDNFECCMEDKKQDFKNQAQSLFVVIMSWRNETASPEVGLQDPRPRSNVNPFSVLGEVLALVRDPKLKTR